MTAINDSRDTLNNSNLLVSLYKCDTMNLLKYSKNPLLKPKIFKQPVDGSYLSGIIYHTGSLVLM